MNTTLKTLLVAVAITLAGVAQAGTVLDNTSYAGGVGSCKAVAQYANINNVVNPEAGARLSKQIEARFRTLQGQDTTTAVNSFNRSYDLAQRAKVAVISEDFTKCVMWVNN